MFDPLPSRTNAVDVKLASSKYKYPPGPKGYPIIGAAPLIPTVNPGPTLAKMAEGYGEMMTLKLGGMTWVFINSSRVATEILERRSGVLRPRLAPHLPNSKVRVLITFSRLLVLDPSGL
jgi:hypothetical protein